jgi:hypothetical protein
MEEQNIPTPPVDKQSLSLRDKPVEVKKSFPVLNLLMVLIILVLLGSSGYLAYQNMKLTKELSGMKTVSVLPTASPIVAGNYYTPTPVATADVTADWKTYSNSSMKFDVKYPNSWTVIKETSNVELGFGVGDQQPVSYLTISSKKSIDFSSLKECTQQNSTFPCITTGKVIADITVGGVVARSAYLNYGTVDADFRVVQTFSIELKMNISGGGLDNTFDQILSTFKFTN